MCRIFPAAPTAKAKSEEGQPVVKAYEPNAVEQIQEAVNSPLMKAIDPGGTISSTIGLLDQGTIITTTVGSKIGLASAPHDLAGHVVDQNQKEAALVSTLPLVFGVTPGSRGASAISAEQNAARNAIKGATDPAASSTGGWVGNQPNNLWRVGPYNQLKGVQSGLDAHHVGQKALMKRFEPQYNLNTAPSILVPEVGHTVRGANGIVSRSTSGIGNARQLLARDIFELRRVYGSQGIPNSSLEQLIQMNKTMYPSSFIK